MEKTKWGYIKNLQHLINLIKKYYRESQVVFGEKEFYSLVDLWNWCQTHTNCYEINQFTWSIREKILEGEEVDIEAEVGKFKKQVIEKGPVGNSDDISLELGKALAKRVDVCGIYKIYDKQKNLLYIGRSKNLSVRPLTSIRARKRGFPYYISFVDTKSYADAAILEAYFIVTEKPSMNRDMATIENISVRVENVPEESNYIKIYE